MEWFTTSIYKEPVIGRVTLNPDGDKLKLCAACLNV